MSSSALSMPQDLGAGFSWDPLCSLKSQGWHVLVTTGPTDRKRKLLFSHHGQNPKPRLSLQFPVSHDIKILRATIKPHFPSVVPLQLRDSVAQHQSPEAGRRSSPSEPQSPSSPFTHSQSFSSGSAPPPHFHSQPATNLQTPELNSWPGLNWTPAVLNSCTGW